MNEPKKESRKIYISGPMTGIKDHNFAAFDEAADYLRSQGWPVVSPADIAREEGVTETSSCDGALLRRIQEQDVALLLTCKALFMLSGWHNSAGATAEHNLARWLGLEIKYQDEQDAVPKGLDPKGAIGKTKDPLWLLPPVAQTEAAWAHQTGATKYGPWNWRSTKVNASTYISAALRHLNAWASGKNQDEESKRSHLGHVVACCNILMDAQAHDCLADDRAVPPTTSEQ